MISSYIVDIKFSEKKCGFKGKTYESNMTSATYGQELLSLLQHLSSPQFLVVFVLLDL